MNSESATRLIGKNRHKSSDVYLEARIDAEGKPFNSYSCLVVVPLYFAIFGCYLASIT